MTEFFIGANRLLVDVEQTRAYYAAHEELRESCSCADCRNFRLARHGLPEKAGRLLKSLGLTLDQPAEVMEQGREPDGWHRYTLQYHLVGKLLARGDTPMELAPGVTAGFTVGSGPFLREFPEPFFQLFLDVRLPWLLDEERSTICP